MSDKSLTKSQLLSERSSLKNKVAELEKSETERVEAEQALRDSRHMLQTVLDSIPASVFWKDRDSLYLGGNRTWLTAAGLNSSEEVIGKSDYELPWDKTLAGSFREDDKRVMGSGIPEYDIIETYTRVDGSQSWARTNKVPLRDRNGNIVGIIGTYEDITEQKLAEVALQESEEKYRTLSNNIPDIIYSLDKMGNVLAVNEHAVLHYGYEYDSIVGKPFLNCIHPDDREMVSNSFLKAVEDHREYTRGLQFRVLAKDESVRWVELDSHMRFDEQGRYLQEEGVLRDITERKQAEEALRESEALFKNYIENAPDGIYMNDLQGNFIYGNRKSEEIIGYRREELIGKNFLELNIISENSLNKAALLLQANIEGKSTGPDEIELIRKGERLIPIEINTSVIQRKGQKIVLGFVRDIPDRKKAEAQRQEVIHRLRKTLGATIKAMAAVSEARDPYTAGHQRRVADLARSIATEMNLQRDQIEGVRMASLIHDIGKISVPVEILSKPTKLTAAEFALIKVHPRTGSDMLKDIEFTCPISRIVLEHHERMNGSGYPNGLKGEDIITESRILMVADVVEAISSHRPYRPGAGVELALDEITKDRGVRYDSDVVDACIRLFHGKGYEFKALDQ
jgi:PAS domain S-box-containing protein